MGTNTNICVYSTTIAAANLGYTSIVIRAAVATMRGTDSHGDGALAESRSIAWGSAGEAIVKHSGA